MTSSLTVGSVIKKIKLLPPFVFVKLLVVALVFLMEIHKYVDKAIFLEKTIINAAVKENPIDICLWGNNPSRKQAFAVLRFLDHT